MKVLIIFALILSAANAGVVNSVNAEPISSEGIQNCSGDDESLFPYQVAIYVRRNQGYLTFCSGSLISNEWILTEANCMVDIMDGEVHLGATPRNSPSAIRNIKFEDVVVPPTWNSSAFFDDNIALIHIKPVTFSDKINAVKLPPLDSDHTYIEECVVLTSWNLVSNDSTTANEVLQSVPFLVMGNELCTSVYTKYDILDSESCAFTAGRIADADVGSPLVLSSTKEQIGINSFQLESNSTKITAVVYTRITSFLPWIKERTGVFYTY